MSVPNRKLHYYPDIVVTCGFEFIDLTLSVVDIYQRVENDEMQAFRQNQIT